MLLALKLIKQSKEEGHQLSYCLSAVVNISRSDQSRFQSWIYKFSSGIRKWGRTHAFLFMNGNSIR